MGETLIDSGSDEHAFGDDGCVSESGLIIGTYLHGLLRTGISGTLFWVIYISAEV